ncbi:glycosyltransferase family 4 protein [Pectobacteriaceae bacterium CE90]|nr:glycosyltransferase family 4 protein [Pectobacteriaceae bacterium CE90]
MLFLVDMPPPVHGMSNINLAMYNRVLNENIAVVVIDTTPHWCNLKTHTRRWKLVKILHTLWVMIRILKYCIFSSDKKVYRPINGDRGQVFDYLYLGLLSWFKCSIIIHHHSFNYIHTQKKLFKKLVKVLQGDVRHIVLSDNMGALLSSLYGIPRESFITISNASFFNDAECYTEQRRHDSMLTLGHLSNLCLDKGIGIISKTIESLNKATIPFTFILAGPFADEKSKNIVAELCGNNHNVKYIGPVYGELKKAFFSNIDIFLFPSIYKNEAEPLVLYEAAQQGALLIGSETGCMKEMISSLDGISVGLPPERECPDLFIDAVVSYITATPMSDIQRAKNHRKNQFQILVAKNRLKLQQLMKDFTDV